MYFFSSSLSHSVLLSLNFPHVTMWWSLIDHLSLMLLYRVWTCGNSSSFWLWCDVMCEVNRPCCASVAAIQTWLLRHHTDPTANTCCRQQPMKRNTQEIAPISKHVDTSTIWSMPVFFFFLMDFLTAGSCTNSSSSEPCVVHICLLFKLSLTNLVR